MSDQQGGAFLYPRSVVFMPELIFDGSYTMIPNKLLESMAKIRLSGREWCIIHAILRHTYGYHEKTAAISLTKLQEMTGVFRHHCVAIVRGLEEKGIICVEHGSVRRLSMVADPTKWKCVTESGVPELGVTESGVTVDGNGGVTGEGNKSVTVEGNSNMPSTLFPEQDSEAPKERKKKRNKLPAKNRREVKSDSEAPKVNSWGVWVDAHRKVFDRDPVGVPKDFKASKTILELLNVDAAELYRIYTDYLKDKDPFIVNNGHGLSFLIARINKYTAKKYYSIRGGHEITKAMADAEELEMQEMDRHIKAEMEAEAKMPKPAPLPQPEGGKPNATVARLLKVIDPDVEF
jgi:phage replication O-like protein O